MKNNAALIALLLLSLLLSSSALYAQTTVMWTARSLPISIIGDKAGQYYDPQICPSDKQWMSFEVNIEKSRALMLANSDLNLRYEITTMKQKETSGDILEGTQQQPVQNFTGSLAWCPQRIDGEQFFAFVSSNGQNNDIYLSSLSHPLEYFRITDNESVDDYPVWSPDGKQLIFTSGRTGRGDIYIIKDVPGLINRMKNLKSENKTEIVGEALDDGKWFARLTDNPNEELFPAWSPSGKYIVYTVLSSPGDILSSSELDAKNVTTGKVIPLMSDKTHILRNPSFSPDGRYLAYYSAGKLTEETVNLIVSRFLFDAGEINGLAEKWTYRDMKKFEGVKSRLHGGPYWTIEGGLLLINNTNGDGNAIYEIEPRSFARTGSPLMNVYSLWGEQTLDFDVIDFDLVGKTTSSADVTFSAQQGEKFGIYSSRYIPPESSKVMVGLLTGVLRPRGDVTYTEFGNGTKLFINYPFNNDFILSGSIGGGELKGHDFDRNKFERKFTSIMYFVSLQGGYKLFSYSPFTLIIKGGIGGAYLNSLNTSTKGLKILLPGGFEGDVSITKTLSVVFDAGFTYSTGDLDGLRSSLKNDQFFNFSIGIANMLAW